MNSITNSATKETNLVVVMISNGPGELTTWVKPLADQLHASLSLRPLKPSSKISLRLVLVPCPNATGHEKRVAESFGTFESVSSAKDFWKILINPQKYGFWPTKGIVVFLGGDQFWSVLFAARLKYKNIAYAEWIARWPFWNDRIAAMSPQVKKQISKKFQHRCIVVGDLMADIQQEAKINDPLPKGKWIAILPGSKKAKLSVGIPFFLEVIDQLKQKSADLNFLIPLAPTTNLDELLYFSSARNPIANKYKSKIIKIVPGNKKIPWKKLITNTGTYIYLIEEYPAHKFISQCNLAITTIGANTAELGALSVPMIVVVPTQHLNVMNAWDGIIGLIARLPICKWFIGILIGIWKLKEVKYMAWPNIVAKKMIVPERIGKYNPKDIADEAFYWISSEKRLQGQKENLKALRGKSGATKLIAQEIINLISILER